MQKTCYHLPVCQVIRFDLTTSDSVTFLTLNDSDIPELESSHMNK